MHGFLIIYNSGMIYKNLFVKIILYIYKNWELFITKLSMSLCIIFFLNMNSKWFKNRSSLIIYKMLYIKYSYAKGVILKSLLCRISNKVTHIKKLLRIQK